VTVLLIAMALDFAWPSAARAPSVTVGHIDDFAPGSVTHVNTGVQVYIATLLDAGERPAALWVVRYEDGSLAVFSAYDPRTGCTLPWRESTTVPGLPRGGFFQDPCHGTSYTIDGRRVFGPSARDMDRFEFTVHAGTVEVHLDRLRSQP
jgi:Rieske Fe-S protein